MVRPEPHIPDNENRKLAYFTQMGQVAAHAELRSNFKQFEAWHNMFPLMFEHTDGKIPLVSETSAQKIATVFTCLNVLGETRGSLPFDVKKVTPNGPVTDYEHPVHRLIHDRPNPYTTAFDFWSTVEKLKKAWGNAYAEVKSRDVFGNATELDLWESWDVELVSTPGGELYYRYKGRTVRATEVLHFKNYSANGKVGISTIRQNALTLGLSMKLSQYNSSIIGERPYGYLTSEKRPKDMQMKGAVRSLWDKRSVSDDEKDEANPSVSMKSIGGIPYLYGGLEFRSFTLPADDVAYIESAKLTDQDIYGIFRVPPTFAQNWERAPYNSSEQQDIVFAKYSLASIRGDEQECTEKLFPESNKKTQKHYAKINLKGLLRGDTNTRKEFYASGIQNGYLTPNQVCELEDLPTYGPDGDQHFLQGALVPVNKIADMIASKVAGAGQGQTREQIQDEFKKQFLYQLREKIRPKMNGHWKEIEEFLN